MTKKMKISSIFKKRETGAASWQWPSCTHSKTLSFRANDNNIFKTINSIYIDPCDDHDGVDQESWFFTNSSESTSSFSTESEYGNQPLEMIIKGVRSARLFFEPGSDTSSILDEPKPCSKNQEPEDEQEIDDLPFKESIVMAMESDDPYMDFKKSMKEMVESEGIKEWEDLQELLAWYLRMNGEMNHGFVVGAFVDLLIELATCTNDDSISTSHDSSVASSFSCPSSPLSHLGHERARVELK